MMLKRFRLTFAVVSLMALAVLLMRPIALDALGMPFGSHSSPTVELVKVHGSHHCELLSDCEAISFTSFGIDLSRVAVVMLIAGFVTVLAQARIRTLYFWASLVPNPPPLSPIG
jgi:hypothetical protein